VGSYRHELCYVFLKLRGHRRRDADYHLDAAEIERSREGVLEKTLVPSLLPEYQANLGKEHSYRRNDAARSVRL
jgi:hypothetical protein